MQYAKSVTLNVEECDRLSFLPYLFGLDFLYAEASVYALAKKMMPEYEGGFWHFIRLPDGGGYMMPDGDRFHMGNGANWFDRTVSADAAGVILTSLVINRQLWLYHDSGELMEEKRVNRLVTVPAVLLEKVMVMAGSEIYRLHAVGSENGGDGDAFVREEREIMRVMRQALDGENG